MLKKIVNWLWKKRRIIFFSLVVSWNFLGWFPYFHSINLGRDIIQFNEISILHQEKQYNNDNASRNAAMRSSLLSYLNIQRVERIEQASSKTQLRGFYITALTVILSLIFPMKKNRELILLIPLMTTFTFYALEIQQDDINQRYNGWNDRYTDAHETILNAQERDTIVYNLTYYALKTKLDDVYGSGTQWRKFLSFMKPDVDQFLIFVTPMLLLIFIPFCVYGKHIFIRT